MKDRINISPLFPLFICSFLPLLTLILHLFGYSVSLISYEVFSVVSAIICIISVYLIKESNHNKSTRIFITFLPLLQLINSAVYVYKSRSAITVIFMAVCFIACAVISEKVISSNKAKVASVITSMLLFVFLVIISFAGMIASNFGSNTVVKTVDSPNGEYYAEIVDSDEGALGGNTVVYVKKSKPLNLLLLIIEKSPERVYIGEWGEYKTMEIKWKDESTLLINSTEYKINT